MPPKKDKNSNYQTQEETTRIIINLNAKNEINWKTQNGVRINDNDILHDLIPDTSTSKSDKVKYEQTPNYDKFARASQYKIRIVEMENILREKMKDLQNDKIQFNDITVKDMAKDIYEDLEIRDLCEGLIEIRGDEYDSFVPKETWLERFKMTYKYHFSLQSKEKIVHERFEIKKFLNVFREEINREKYLPEQVFSADATKLFWKRLPDNDFIPPIYANEAMSRISLMLASNASGDFKIEPMLIYHDDDLEVFTKNIISSDNMGVFWRCNKDIKMTHLDFIKWMAEVFCPSLNLYLEVHKMEKKVLLLLNNAQEYHPNIDMEIKKIYPYINVILIPKGVSHYLHPINSQVIDSFRRLYTKKVFQLCLKAVRGTQLEPIEALKRFWQIEFHILQAIDVIVSVWGSYTANYLNSTWGIIWPEIQRTVSEMDSPIIINSEITAIAQVLGLNTEYNDIENLINYHNKPVLRSEILQLKIKSKNNSNSVPTEMLERCLDAWSVFEKILPYHPTVAEESCIVVKFKLIVIYFQMVLRDRKMKEIRELQQKQLLAENESKNIKRQKIENSADFDLMNLPPGTSNTYFLFE